MADVVVEGDGAGALVVSWELAGGDAEVDVAVGTTPDSIDHVHAVTVGARERSVRIEGLSLARQYVSVSPASGGSAVVAAERRMPFEGAVNFRDLGGYRTADGRRTRWGRLFRSDGLHRLSEADVDALTRLGLRVVYDLRTDRERSRAPSRLPEDDALRRVELALIAEVDDRPLAERLRDGERFLVELYRGMLAESAPLFGTLVRGLAAPGGLPALFHCSAGKDRTGMAAAVTLLVLGVPEETVLDDYELTAVYAATRRGEQVAYLQGAGVAPEAAAGVMGASRWAMATVLDELRATYGSVEAYLTDAAGVTPPEVAAVRRALLS